MSQIYHNSYITVKSWNGSSFALSEAIRRISHSGAIQFVRLTGQRLKRHEDVDVQAPEHTSTDCNHVHTTDYFPEQRHPC